MSLNFYSLSTWFYYSYYCRYWYITWFSYVFKRLRFLDILQCFFTNDVSAQNLELHSLHLKHCFFSLRYIGHSDIFYTTIRKVRKNLSSKMLPRFLEWFFLGSVLDKEPKFVKILEAITKRGKGFNVLLFYKWANSSV